MNSYVVRIYRDKKNKPQLLVGIVEEVGVEGKRMEPKAKGEIS